MQYDINIGLISLMLFILCIFTIFLFHKGREKYSNVLLGIYLISQIIGILGNFLIYGFSVGKSFQFISYSVIFAWLPLFYFYVLSLLYTDFRLNKSYFFHLIPFFVVFVTTALAYSLNVAGLSFFKKETFTNFLGFFFNFQVLFYNIFILINYRKYIRNLQEQYSAIDRTANNWIKTSVFGFLIACIIVQISNYSMRFHFLTSVNWYMAGNGAFFIFFNILFYKAIIRPDFIKGTQLKEKYRYSNLNAKEAAKILEELESFMLSKKPFTDANLSLKALSKMINIPERHVSQVINEYKRQNFFDFVNSHRVQYAMELLKNKNNCRRTMLDILFDSGFNSKSSFNTAFKKYSGYTPSGFRKIHSEI